jgi:thiol-disulfide isomerase/thioredoxin
VKKRLRAAAAAFSLLTTVAFATSPSTGLSGEVDARGLTEAVAREKGKVVLVNFWATWCVPCREEFPDLSRLQKTLGPKGFALIGVSTDFAREAAAVRKFLAEQKPAFPNYQKKSGGDDQVFIEAVDKEWGGELPFSVLYDRTGRKAGTFSGKHSYDEYEKEILRLAGK